MFTVMTHGMCDLQHLNQLVAKLVQATPAGDTPERRKKQGLSAAWRRATDIRHRTQHHPATLAPLHHGVVVQVQDILTAQGQAACSK